MIHALDHATVAVADLDAAIAGYTTVLGRAPLAHWSEGPRAEAWFQLTNMALRLTTAASGQPEGLAALAFATSDLAKAQSLLSRRGLEVHAVDDAGVDTSGDKATASRLLLSTASTYGAQLALVERAPGARPPLSPATGADEAAVSGLDHVVVMTTNTDRAVALYGGRLGLDLRLDRTNPQWKNRLLFFRCGGLVVEISHSLDRGISDGPDRFRGLAWRVPDARAAQPRIAAAGIDVSEVRVGRRPGSHVFTVRDSTGGVPTLMLEAEPNPAA